MSTNEQPDAGAPVGGSAGPRVSRRQVLAAGGAAMAGAAVAGSLAPAASAQATGAAATSAGASRSASTFAVDFHGATSHFGHYWEAAVGGDHAKQGLRRDYQDALLRSHRELGVQSVRTHGILAPQMSVYEPSRPASSGGLYSFFNVDQFYDYLVGNGMHPYIEVSAMPAALAAPGGSLIFYYGFLNSPPSSFSEWGTLVGTFARHLVDRYGLAEVRKWPFEIWNEPNLSFWGGTEDQYHQLYQYAAEAIKGVDASLRVGGPATDGDGLAFLERFLSFVESNDVPIDFVSSHAYENNSLSGVNGVEDVFRPTRAAIPAGLEYIVSETGCNYDNVTDELDTSYAAASWVKTVDRCDKTVDAMSLWCFSDIFEEQTQASQIFWGGFGSLTMYDVPKPLYRAGQLLHGLGTRRLGVTSPSSLPATLGALAVKDGRGGLDVLIWNHTYQGGPAATSERVTLTVQGSPSARGTLTRIDAQHANPRQRWFDQGSPQYPTRRQLDELTTASELHSTAIRGRRHDGHVTYELTVPGEGVAALHIG